MFDKAALLQKLQQLPFRKTQYWLVAGGAMVLYGIRPQTADLDLGCTTALADQLTEEGRPVEWGSDHTRHILYEKDVELFENWFSDEVVLYEGVPVLSLKGLVAMKQTLGREKDLRDLALIEQKYPDLREPGSKG